MATLSINLSGSAVVTGTKSYTLNDTDVQALLDWAAVAINPLIQATFNPTNDPGFTPTNQQIMLMWVQCWVNGTTDAVKKFKQDAAAETARSATSGIVIV